MIKSILSDLRKIIKESSYYMGNYESSMLVTYWKVGSRIALEVDKYDIKGEDFNDFIKELASKLLCGISYNKKSLLKYYEFYQSFKDFDFLVQYLDNITWKMIRILIKDVEDADSRNFYLQQASINDWDNIALYLHIKDNYYENRKHIEEEQTTIKDKPLESDTCESSIEVVKNNETTEDIVVSYSFIKDLETIIKPSTNYSDDKETNRIITYWKIGERIYNEEKFLSWTKTALSMITSYASSHLNSSCKRGFNATNLKIYTSLYTSFPDYDFFKNYLQNINWKYFHVLLKIKDSGARLFYLKHASENKWDIATLVKRVSKNYYSYYLQLQQDIDQDNNSDISKSSPDIQETQENELRVAIGNLEETGKISELKEKIILSTEMYLMNSGKGFAFVDRQKHIKAYYVDLIFYNYKLKCFVIFKFVTNVLTENNINDLECFAKTYDITTKDEGDNPSICILVGIDSKQDRIYYCNYNPDNVNLQTLYLQYLPSAEELLNIIKQQKLSYISWSDDINKKR